ncbi:MAG: excinuclease ABC subunit UvrC [Eubacteriales bacterium]|nr:excinuclease ABC subunit UvrC [Eubacteriales bacterium]
MERELFNIEEELKKLPTKPGVYIMHDDTDAIIYVGKAVNLKNRVRQYFQSSRNKSVKITNMVTHIAYFEYMVTGSELEALVLENNLIKENNPRYNTMLKDDKTYPFIKVTMGEAYPRLFSTRKVKKDKGRYFGPFTNAKAVSDTIELLQSMYQIRTCQRVLPRDIDKERPCLYYHIGRCSAPCMSGTITQPEYGERIEQVLRFLSGDSRALERELEEKMRAAAEALEFEEAGRLRDLLTSIHDVQQKQKITYLDEEDRDIIAMAADESNAVVQVFFIRRGKLIGRDHYFLKLAFGDDQAEALSGFVKQFYAGTPFIPKEIMLQTTLPDQAVIEEWLSGRRGHKVSLLTPKRGTKEKLVEMAAENAAIVLRQDKERLKKEAARTTGAVEELRLLLALDSATRMEAYDISNTAGTLSVGSMVVFENGKPKRSDYRKFRIKTIVGPDDYHSLEEVLTRRFQRSLSGDERFVALPDLIMMDGGRGQVNIAVAVLQKLGLSIPVCGMVKDDKHRTRGLYYQNREMPLDIRSEGFHLITRLQDEAHRFAITYHRELRSKEGLHSVLDDIPGIGEKRRKALLRHFKSIEGIRQADEAALAAVDEMNSKSAAAVYHFFRRD